MLKLALLVGFGGFAGSVCRFLASDYMTKNMPSLFPYGTFVVNSIGCFLIGLIYTLTIDKSVLNNETRLLLATGFCGGFTTFSAFSIETLALFKDDKLVVAGAYIILSVLIGVLFSYVGTLAGKLL